MLICLYYAYIHICVYIDFRYVYMDTNVCHNVHAEMESDIGVKFNNIHTDLCTFLILQILFIL